MDKESIEVTCVIMPALVVMYLCYKAFMNLSE